MTGWNKSIEMYARTVWCYKVIPQPTFLCTCATLRTPNLSPLQPTDCEHHPGLHGLHGLPTFIGYRTGVIGQVCFWQGWGSENTGFINTVVTSTWTEKCHNWNIFYLRSLLPSEWLDPAYWDTTCTRAVKTNHWQKGDQVNICNLTNGHGHAAGT